MAGPTFKIQEVVVATRDVEGAAAKFGQAVGGEIDNETATWPEDGIGIESKGVYLGDFHLGFVNDSGGNGPVARFLDKKGEGLLELCLQTDDLAAAMEQMKAAGMNFVSEEPTVLRDYPWKDETWSEVRLVFVHPASANGMQIELQQWVK